MVRLALLASVICSPPVSFQTSQLSTVPKARASPAAVTAGQWSSIQRILVAEK